MVVRTALLSELEAEPKQEGRASFFFFDTRFAKESVKVLPGEHYVSNKDVVIGTVLGSCVAACIYDTGARVGGMNHFMLPDGDSGSGRFGTFAMEVLINELIKLGARRGSLESKVFGGGAMRAGVSTDIGKLNVEFVERFLSTERIPLISKDVLEQYPRRVVMFPTSGKVMVKRLAPTAVTNSDDERRYAARVARRVRSGGEVELF